MEENNKVLVALSGGVDSCVTVHMLQKRGFDVGAVVLKMSPAHDQTVEDAKKAADKFNIPIYVVDMQQQFKENVIDYFINEYKSGRTPNPCIMCNPKVKFKALFETADKYGYYQVATGHYAKLDNDQNGYMLLKKGSSLKRDQSYMLYRLPQSMLKRLMFPLAEIEKDQVRQTAREIGLFSADKPDSQENCFIPDNDYAKYIEEHAGKSLPGNFISPEGKPCGKHKGIIHYTVGQRKKLGIALGRPVFISEIDPVSNNIYLSDAGNDLFESCIITNMVFSAYQYHEGDSFKAEVKIRSAALPQPCTVNMLSDNSAEVVFDVPLRAVAKGQSLVLYNNDIVIGGGIAENPILYIK